MLSLVIPVLVERRTELKRLLLLETLIELLRLILVSQALRSPVTWRRLRILVIIGLSISPEIAIAHDLVDAKISARTFNQVFDLDLNNNQTDQRPF